MAAIMGAMTDISMNEKYQRGTLDRSISSTMIEMIKIRKKMQPKIRLNIVAI